jgi:hypothetical protein
MNVYRMWRMSGSSHESKLHFHETSLLPDEGQAHVVKCTSPTLRWRSTEERRRVTRVGLVHLTRLTRPGEQFALLIDAPTGAPEPCERLARPV